MLVAGVTYCCHREALGRRHRLMGSVQPCRGQPMQNLPSRRSAMRTAWLGVSLGFLVLSAVASAATVPTRAAAKDGRGGNPVAAEPFSPCASSAVAGISQSFDPARTPPNPNLVVKRSSGTIGTAPPRPGYGALRHDERAGAGRRVSADRERLRPKRVLRSRSLLPLFPVADTGCGFNLCRNFPSGSPLRLI